MCGVVGFNWVDRKLLKSMCRVIAHRGPDGEGFYVDDKVSLGHRRLAIIDLSTKGKQPMCNENGTVWITYNGEIYNYQELRKELEQKGHKFKSNTDTEVIIHSYEEYGFDCLKNFNGMFAFCIYDQNKNLMFLARDRIGIKPLYYYFKNNKLIFASEIKAILEHNIPRVVDIEALNHYLHLLYVPTPLTMFKDIFKFPPANYAIFKNNKLEFTKYWDVEDLNDINSKEQIINKIKTIMDDSVKHQLISDRPVGIFLSGGIDSTVVLGVAKKFLKDKLQTFSVGFNTSTESEKFNADLKLARKTSEYYKTNHHELIISGQDVLDNINQAIYHLDEPIANLTQVATFLLAKKAKDEVAVVLGGDGGDELFGGYERYYYFYLINKFKSLPRFIQQSSIFLMSRILKNSKFEDKLKLNKNEEMYLSFMSQKENIIKRIINKEFNKNNITKEFFKTKYFNLIYKDSFVKQLMITDMKTWLVDESLSRTDKMTMAFGLEQRVPIIDHRLIELAFKIPTKLKINRKHKTKIIFKQAMKDYIPKHILNQPKRGWFSPGAKWLRNDLKDFSYNVLSRDYNTETSSYFNFDIIKEVLHNHISGKEYNFNIIWALITFQIWAKIYNVRFE